MAGGFVICEYETVKEEFPEFRKLLEDARRTIIEKALEDWSPLKFAGIRDTPLHKLTAKEIINKVMAQSLSGMAPTAGEFGESPIMPQLFRDITNTRLTTWSQTFNATGHQTIISGANGGLIYEDYKIALVGLVFLDKAIRVSEIKMQISDKKLPRINVEEALAYNKPAIVLEDYYILDEEQEFELYGYVLSQGHQAIKLLGTQVNRVPNKLQTTDTGAALT